MPYHPAQPRHPIRLKVLTINIWNRQGPWDQRLELLRAGIAELDPDVIGFQEVLTDGKRSLADDIVEGLDHRVVFGVAKALAGGISFGNAVSSRWPIVSQHVEPLPDAGTGESRSLLLTTIDTPAGALPFATTHLNWKFHHGFAREAQVQAVARSIGERFPVHGASLPPVLCGDFNARPDSTEIRFLGGLHAIDGHSVYLADCFEQVGEGAGYTFDARVNPHAAFTHEAPRRIDYVFVRGPDSKGRGRPTHCRVVLRDVVDGAAASDHFGVYAEIQM